MPFERPRSVSLAFAIAVCAAGCSGGGGSPAPSTSATATPVATSSSGVVFTGGSPSPAATATASSTATSSPSSTSSPSASATNAAVSASSSFSVNGAGSSVPLTSSGYSGTLVYPSNDTTTASGAFVMQNTAPGTLPNPQSPGTPVLYFNLQLSSRVDFVGQGFAVTNVTLPSNVSTSGKFTETFYDQTTGTEIGSSTGTLSGGTLSFGAVETMSFTLAGGDIYLFEITEQ